MSRDPLLFLEDIEKSCEKVVRYTEDARRSDPVAATQRILRATPGKPWTLAKAKDDRLGRPIKEARNAVSGAPKERLQLLPGVWRSIA